jgi:hypothetical protein
MMDWTDQHCGASPRLMRRRLWGHEFAISSVVPANNGQAAASKSNLRWLHVPATNHHIDFASF